MVAKHFYYRVTTSRGHIIHNTIPVNEGEKRRMLRAPDLAFFFFFDVCAYYAPLVSAHSKRDLVARVHVIRHSYSHNYNVVRLLSANQRIPPRSIP